MRIRMLLATLLLIPAAFAQVAYTEGYLTLPAPAGALVPAGIDNNNQITGYFTSGLTHGFIWSDGVFGQIDMPGAQETYMLGINSKHGAVGFESTAAGYQGVEDGALRFKVVKGASGRFIRAINNAGSFAGYDSSGNAFLNVKGVYNAVIPSPCAALAQPVQVYIGGLNSNNDLAGYCLANGSQVPTGFARIGGVDQPVNVFGLQTFPAAINDSGTIAGYYYDASNNPHGFLLYSGGGAIQFDFGANLNGTEILAINNHGSLTGVTLDSRLGWVGFFALAN